jgi:hypothetical protein
MAIKFRLTHFQYANIDPQEQNSNTCPSRNMPPTASLPLSQMVPGTNRDKRLAGVQVGNNDATPIRNQTLLCV